MLPNPELEGMLSEQPDQTLSMQCQVSEGLSGPLEPPGSLPRQQPLLHLLATWPYLGARTLSQPVNFRSRSLGQGAYVCKMEHAPWSSSQVVPKEGSFTFELFPKQMLFYFNLTTLCAPIPNRKSQYTPRVQVPQFEYHYKT